MVDNHLISIVICTRNRSDALRKCLDSFEMMLLPQNILLELVVVDNNSSDDTRNVIFDFTEQSTLTVKYVYESRKGLGNARNTGIAYAEGEIIAFTDDDCIVDPNWVNCLVKEFHSDPDLSVIGGRVELFDLLDKPVTIMTSTERCYFLSTGQLFSFIHGCNMAFDRKVFKAVGNFDGRFGAGTKISSAEDLDIIYRVHKSGFKVLYCPDLLVYHNHGRRTDSEVVALERGYTIGRGAFYCKHILKGDVNILRRAYWEMSFLIKSAINSPRNCNNGFVMNLLIGACNYLIPIKY